MPLARRGVHQRMDVARLPKRPGHSASARGERL
jgi:hypothetical protein